MSRKLLLLGLLRQRDMHGYELHEFINRDLANCTDLKKSTAYFLLNKMADDGWVIQAIEQEGNRPPRQVYSLTPAGEAAYQELLRTNLATYEPVYFPSDISIAFLDELSAAEGLSLLSRRRESLLELLEKTKQAPMHQGYLQWLIEHQLRHLQDELDWLDEIILRLSGQNASDPIEIEE
jgi:DNA-binding PadR family transcriptional regulator